MAAPASNARVNTQSRVSGSEPSASVPGVLTRSRRAVLDKGKGPMHASPSVGAPPPPEVHHANPVAPSAPSAQEQLEAQFRSLPPETQELLQHLRNIGPSNVNTREEVHLEEGSSSSDEREQVQTRGRFQHEQQRTYIPVPSHQVIATPLRGQAQTVAAPPRAPPTVAEEVRRLVAEQVSSLLAEKERLAAAERAAPRRRHPLTERIRATLYPRKFQVPRIETYAGTVDPVLHLDRHEMSLLGQNVSEDLHCLLLPATFSGVASDWFRSLPSSSIDSYDDLRIKFTERFGGIRRARKTAMDLLSMHQQDDESLAEWYDRFFRAKAEVEHISQQEQINAFRMGLRHRALYDELVMHEVHTVNDLFKKVEEHIRVEENWKNRDAETRKQFEKKDKPVEKRKFDDKSVTQRKEPPRDNFARYDRDKPRHAPIHISLTQALREIKKKNLAPLPRPGSENLGKMMDQYCEYHGGYGHATEKCRALRQESDRLQREGKLTGTEDGPRHADSHHDKPRSSGSSRSRSHAPGSRGGHRADPVKSEKQPEQRDDAPPVRREAFNHIAGGLAAGGSTSNQRRHYAKEVLRVEASRRNEEPPSPAIVFEDSDASHVATPHDDPLVISLPLGRWDVKRVLIDNGCSSDIMFYDAFRGMGFADSDMQPFQCPLTGFGGTTVMSLGIIPLEAEFGSGKVIIRKTLQLLVADTPSAYNVIIGRPTLNSMKAIPSTYHQKLKLITPRGIGEMLGDQTAARKCYLVSAKNKGKEACVVQHHTPAQVPTTLPAQLVTRAGASAKPVWRPASRGKKVDSASKGSAVAHGKAQQVSPVQRTESNHFWVGSIKVTVGLASGSFTSSSSRRETVGQAAIPPRGSNSGGGEVVSYPTGLKDHRAPPPSRKISASKSGHNKSGVLRAVWKQMEKEKVRTEETGRQIPGMWEVQDPGNPTVVEQGIEAAKISRSVHDSWPRRGMAIHEKGPRVADGSMGHLPRRLVLE